MSKEWFVKEGGQVCLKADNGELNGWDTQSLVDCLNGKEIKIADLEAKLAESENQRQHLKDWLDDEILTSVDHESYNATINEYEEEINQLKQQLAEKEKAIENWQTMYQSVMQSSYNGIEEDKRLREQLGVQSKWLGALDEVIKQLKEQLADKNKEIEEKNNIIEFLNGFKNAVKEELKKELR